ncbi:MAG: protein-L-isoaspartate(D-aspartate) O-methyltransferase [Halobacteriota archaeon]
MSLEPERISLLQSLKRRGISERVVSAMNAVKREDYLPHKWHDYAYLDEPLPIGNGQTISAPHMVAIMCELLSVEPSSNVLEIGTGSGYHAAVLAHLAGDGTVYTIERFERLAQEARKRVPANVIVTTGDGSLGFAEKAPFDRILVTCSAPDIPPPLLAQLKAGGRMVIPLGRGFQELYLVCKNHEITKEAHGAVAFVLLVGKYGFSEARDGGRANRFCF